MDPAEPGNRDFNGTLLIALDVATVAPAEQFAEAAGRLAAQVASTPPLPRLKRVLLPGEPELAMRARRLDEGVPLADADLGCRCARR